MSEIKKRLECILMPEYFVKDRRGGKRVVDAVAPELERLEELIDGLVMCIRRMEKTRQLDEKRYALIQAQAKRIDELERRNDALATRFNDYAMVWAKERINKPPHGAGG